MQFLFSLGRDAFGAMVLMLAAISPIFAQTHESDPSAWVGGLGLLRDGCNGLLIAVIAWSFRWFTLNVGPEIRGWVIEQRQLTAQLRVSNEAITGDIGEIKREVRQLRESCPAAAFASHGNHGIHPISDAIPQHG
ncbi:MAG: hypothetical protein NT069_25915 [Planctomycetota bacterium]|nr:hypothetical protein [Planctomycetota bacterium]